MPFPCPFSILPLIPVCILPPEPSHHSCSRVPAHAQAVSSARASSRPPPPSFSVTPNPLTIPPLSLCHLPRPQLTLLANLPLNATSSKMQRQFGPANSSRLPAKRLSPRGVPPPPSSSSCLSLLLPLPPPPPSSSFSIFLLLPLPPPPPSSSFSILLLLHLPIRDANGKSGIGPLVCLTDDSPSPPPRHLHAHSFSLMVNLSARQIRTAGLAFGSGRGPQ